LEDLDLALGGPWGDFIEVNMLDMLINTANITNKNPLWSTLLFRSLVENDGFKSRFKEKYSSYLNTTFQTDRVLSILDNITSTIAPEIPRHARRWRDENEFIFNNLEEWNSNVSHLKDIIRGRHDIVLEELSSF
jgi:spore coat protein CotH